MELSGSLVETLLPGRFESGLRTEIAKVASYQSVGSGKTLMTIGAYLDALPIVVSGNLKVFVEDEEGNDFFMYYINPGESCAMAIGSSLNRRKSMVKVISDGEVELIRIPAQFINSWSTKFPSWKIYVMECYEKRFEKLVNTIDTMAFNRLDSRIVKYLNLKSELNKSSDVEITHKEIADELHSSRVVVSRLLKKLEEKGVVKLSRNRIRMLAS